MNFPNTLPAAHKSLLIKIIDTLSTDPRIMAIGASGSYSSNSMDEYSDLDLTIAIDADSYDEVMNQRFDIVTQIDGKLAAFTGEHVGEPRLIISLYQPDLIHVDFKFVALPDAAQRVDDVQVLWERDACLSSIYKLTEHAYPQPEPQWIEDRFWIWLHYGAGKIARGEYFEAVEFLSFLRMTVLSPLALKQQGMTPSGVRNIEKRLPSFANELKHTVAMPEREPLIKAFQKTISLYLSLRANETVNANEKAEQLTLDYFSQKLVK
jgi:hypothetical protein